MSREECEDYIITKLKVVNQTVSDSSVFKEKLFLVAGVKFRFHLRASFLQSLQAHPYELLFHCENVFGIIIFVVDAMTRETSCGFNNESTSNATKFWT